MKSQKMFESKITKFFWWYEIQIFLLLQGGKIDQFFLRKNLTTTWQSKSKNYEKGSESNQIFRVILSQKVLS